MSIGYSLTLGGDISLARIAELAVEGIAELREVPGSPGLLSADLTERLGYTVSVDAGRDGYYSAQDGAVTWEWEPDRYVDIDFAMRKDVLPELGRPNMLKAVVRVLAGTTEDAALFYNDDVLLLTRISGVLRKRSEDWWRGKDFDGLFGSGPGGERQ
ncbi:SitI3 family protein [Polymorphospora rubra]|uniref:SitI3 family protein n=1 Tax=Polymorphospora rubra TaxID=338584 RepID=UPI0034109052